MAMQPRRVLHTRAWSRSALSVCRRCCIVLTSAATAALTPLPPEPDPVDARGEATDTATTPELVGDARDGGAPTKLLALLMLARVGVDTVACGATVAGVGVAPTAGTVTTEEDTPVVAAVNLPAYL